MAQYEYDLDPSEPNNTAASVYRMARGGGSRVLDLGSGPGIVAARLLGHDNKEVVCVDSSPEAVVAARQRGIGRVIESDLVASAWIEAIAGEQFDVIIMADVLEHLIEPARLLETIVDQDLLADSGYVVISIPNAGHEAVLTELIRGRFTYSDTGLLDSTHLRFFTLASLRELLEKSGLFITQIERTRRTAEQTTLATHDVALPDELRNHILQAAPEAQTYQFIVKAERADAAHELAEVRERLARTEAQLAEQAHVRERSASADVVAARDAAERRVAELQANIADQLSERATLEQRLGELERALAREQRSTATERKRYERLLSSAERDAVSTDLDKAQRRIKLLEKKLDDVYRSRTWRVGRAVWTAFHTPARLLHRLNPPAQEPVVQSEPAGQDSPAVAEPSPLVENTTQREVYEAALTRSGFTGTGTAVVIAVSTDDLDAGRGDLYTAIGLGRNLEAIGYEVIYPPPQRWYDVPDGTKVYVAMLETVDITRVSPGITTIAWVRNQTAAWTQQPRLGLFDLVLASSPESEEALAAVYPGPTGVLPIGVDTQLFNSDSAVRVRRGVTSTVNQWGREREVFAFLKEKNPDFPLALYGQQRGLADELSEFAHGPVSFFSLPSLYNQARIVLDDFNHTTAGYGNVNSRLFEASACGAQVLTSRAKGLAPLGLGDVGVFSSAGELFELIADGLADDKEMEVAESVRRVVVERHSYVRRAQQFTEYLDRLTHESRSGAGLVVSYYPGYRDNPFTEMLWSQLRTRGGIAVAVDNALDFTGTIRAAQHRPTVFHLNWTAPILGAAATDHDRLVRHRRFIEALDEMHEKGIPLIWTIHNVLPHECADRDLEARLRQEIADRVDVVHVMCAGTVEACADRFEIPQSKVTVIPHPSYIDVYPNLIDRATARTELGLGPDEFVYLHFGQIRPYKGIDRLLDAFDGVSQVEPDSRLLLVGKPGRFEGLRQLRDRARANPRVLENFNAVPDADIQVYMNAADVVVLPHQTALNSGALLLAYSFARPVVAPATGCLEHHVDDSTGILFDSAGGSLAVQNAMLSARDLGVEHGRAAYERAEELHYLEISKQFAEVVDELLQGGDHAATS